MSKFIFKTVQVTSFWVILAWSLGCFQPELAIAGNTSNISGYGNVSNGMGYSNTGYGNMGYGNTGYGNVGYGNVGYGNVGYGNVGYGNMGYGNVGNGMGYGNMGYGNMGYGNMGYGNMGYGNTGYGNMGYGNMGYGNTGYGNTGYGNMGYGMPNPYGYSNGMPNPYNTSGFATSANSTLWSGMNNNMLNTQNLPNLLTVQSQNTQSGSTNVNFASGIYGATQGNGSNAGADNYGIGDPGLSGSTNGTGQQSSVSPNAVSNSTQNYNLPPQGSYSSSGSSSAGSAGF